jgi:hypothetical protein
MPPCPLTVSDASGAVGAEVEVVVSVMLVTLP